jgi:hypothetical protein
MNFTKFLRMKMGQATIEYFVMLTVIVLASALSMRVLWPGLRDAVQGDFFNQSYAGIANADQAVAADTVWEDIFYAGSPWELF